jgi:hypothetical protein
MVFGIICVLLLVALSTIMKDLHKSIFKYKDECMKMQEFYDVLVRWVQLHNKGTSIADYFISHNYKKIAIYGFKELGECMFYELSKSDSVTVSYVIDRSIKNSAQHIKIVAPDDELGDVDAIVVTAIHYYGDICDSLTHKIDCPIISIEDVLFG